MFQILKILLIGSVFQISAILCQKHNSNKPKPYYTGDPKRTEQLVLAEEKVVGLLADFVRDFKTKSNPCHRLVSKYVFEYFQETERFMHIPNRAKQTAENPLHLLKLLHRFRTLRNETFKACRDTDVLQGAILKIFGPKELRMPTKQDYKAALTRVLVLQYVYGLRSEDIRHGILNRTHTNVKLNYDHCLALAKTALQMGGDILSYKWLQSAIESYKEQGLETETSKVKKLRQKLLSHSGYKSKSLFEKEMAGRKHQLKLKGMPDFKRQASCRGQIVMPFTEISRLFCFDITTRDEKNKSKISSINVEILTPRHFFVQLHNFVSEEAIDEIRKQTASSIYQNEEIGTEIFDIIQPKLKSLHVALEKLAGLNITSSRPAEFKKSFHPALEIYPNFKTHSDKNYNYENDDKRVAIMLFLNDVKNGGYSAFEKFGAFAKPIKGSAIVWYPTMEDETVEECPVILGSKETVTQWILLTERAQ